MHRVSALGVHGMAGVILKAVAHVQPSLLGRDEICSNHGTQAPGRAPQWLSKPQTPARPARWEVVGKLTSSSKK
jgi:hypothetical protein